MTTIESPASSRKNAGVRRAARLNCKIDMTPMVDLGFLLISFFVITTELSKPKAMLLNMPADGTGNDLAESNALTIIPSGNNQLYYYFGKWEDAQKKGGIHSAGYAGKNSIRKVIIEKQQRLDNDPRSKQKRDGLMLLIKPTAGASYNNLVNILDEATINVVKIYAVIKLSKAEEDWIKKKEQPGGY
jgi:biopolymer transport protein ExbD